MLTRFVDTCIEDLSNQQITTFKRLLAEQDPELSQWLVDQNEPEDKGLSEIVRIIRKANNL